MRRSQSKLIVEQSSGAYSLDAGAVSDPVAGERLLFVGDDAAGTPIEVIAVVLGDDQLLVIHAMPLRDKYREFYEEEKQWRST